jgi:hypothetical protein
MTIKRQISDPQGWQDSLAAQHFREIKAVVEAATGRLPLISPINLLGSHATLTGMANKLNELINRLQEDPASRTVVVGDGDGTHVLLGDETFGAVPVPDPLLLGDGSAAAPSYSFASDPTNGLYLADADTLGLTVGGVLTWQISAHTLQAVGAGTKSIKGVVVVTGTPPIIQLVGGESGNGVGGQLNITAGSGVGTNRAGGLLFVSGGTATGNAAGGTISITGGNAATGTAGGVTLNTGTPSAGTQNSVLLQIAGTSHAKLNGTEKHFNHMGTTPTLTSGGGGTGSAIAGKDEAFTVTIGTTIGTLTFTVTFANAFTNAPAAVANSDTDIVALKVATTTTTVIVTAAGNFTASSKIHVVVRGYE